LWVAKLPVTAIEKSASSSPSMSPWKKVVLLPA
jgi:hypothetical protein